MTIRVGGSRAPAQTGLPREQRAALLCSQTLLC